MTNKEIYEKYISIKCQSSNIKKTIGNKVNLLLKITKNYLEIQEKFEENLCKIADATLHLLYANLTQMICSNFKWNFC